MWPQTLEMSRDECRGMLRRLELESYSHIISVFRAQGFLSESKTKLLDELRQLFHITQERHRAEVRRASNDEQLCTIAENICGPNTWQEWSREGRRPYPLLPRINPQTALSIVANDLATKAYEENAKLAAPSATGANLVEAMLDQSTYVAMRYGSPKRSEPHVVMDEPFKMPDVPNEVKKATLKRKENDSDNKPNKKRNVQNDKQQQQQTNPMAINEDGNVVPAGEVKTSAHILQQRFFYQQQQRYKQRMANKKPVGTSALHNHSGAGKRAAAPAKSGRRAQKQLQLQQQKQQQKVLLPAPQPAPEAANAIGNQNHVAKYHEVQPHVEYILDEALKSVAPVPTASSYPKAKHNVTRVFPAPPAAERLESPLPPVATRTFANSPVAKEKPAQLPAHQQLSTHVKKYIVEERQVPQPALSPQPQMQPPVAVVGAPIATAVMSTSPNNSTNISTANLPLAPQIISVQQIPAPLSNNKMRPTSAILPPGTKLTPKKISMIDLDATAVKTHKQLPLTPSTAVRLLPYQPDQQQSISNLKDKQPLLHQTPVQKYIVEERPPHQTIATVSPAGITPLSSASTVNIIKNIPASSLNNTLITPLSASATSTNAVPVFRKAPANMNIKTLSATGGNSVTSQQLLGNIKLTTTTGTTVGGQTFNIKQVPSSALRNFKICSPNGKVFLQPTKIPAGSIIHKLNNASVHANSGSIAGGLTASSSLSPTGTTSTMTTPSLPQPGQQQRITIQKMQILTPSQVISSAAGGTTSGAATMSIVSSSTATKVKPATLTFTTAAGGKNNLVFLPASAASGMRTVTIANKPGTVSIGKPNAELVSPKQNVLVVGASPATVASTQLSNKAKSHQLITEDTPIDIINMPIIVAGNNGAITSTTESKVTAATTTVAPTAGAAPTTKTAAQQLVVLNTTDWEMELDQAAKPATMAATTTKTSNKQCPQKLDNVIVECVNEHVEQVDAAAQNANEQANNRIIELDDENNAIEYVDMDLEQPIDVESNVTAKNPTINTTTAASLKTAIVSAQLYEAKRDGNGGVEQQLAAVPAVITTATDP